MTAIFLGLGSNLDPARHLPLGLDALRCLLGPLSQSPVYCGAAIGFDGPPFWNMVVAASTTLAVAQLQAALRDIEYAHGRPENAPRFSSRALDIDILCYGSLTGVIDGVELPRGEILENAFVLRPLAELAPAAVHPLDGRSYAQLWASFDQRSQALAPVDAGLLPASLMPPDLGPGDRREGC